MTSKHSRRFFLKSSAAAAGALAAANFVPAPAVLAADNARNKLRCAVIGCGGQGVGAHVPPSARENLVALCDPDPKRIAAAMKKAKGASDKVTDTSVKIYNDYRKLFDEISKSLDAVFVVTPNHNHALPSLIAMSLGIGVYTEKPMAYCIAEARRMAEFSVKYKVATQMGNQGHSGEGYRRLVEYIHAGAIGDVTEVYHWTDRSNGGTGGRWPTLPTPQGMNWDSWIGPAPYRDYHGDLHPHEWHGWHDFGDGSIGNMACHIMDGARWALDLKAPTAITSEEIGGGSKERYTTTTRLRYDFPAAGNRPAVKVYWYDGKKLAVKDPGTGLIIGSVSEKARNRPEIVDRLEKENNRKLSGDGSVYVGTKGIMYTECYGGGVRILPEAAHRAFKPPAKTIPRIPGGPDGGHHGDFFKAVRGEIPQACSNFVVAAGLTEQVLLGALTIKAACFGLGRKVEWDGNKCTNIPELNNYLSRAYRDGWHV